MQRAQARQKTAKAAPRAAAKPAGHMSKAPERPEPPTPPAAHAAKTHAAAKAAPAEPPPEIDTMVVKAHDDGWALKVDNVDEPAWVVSTKKQAVKAAKKAAQFHEATLRVLTKAGKVQKTMDFASA